MAADPPTTTTVRSPDDVTAEWLGSNLGTGPIAEFATERIGTGQMSENHRVTLQYAAEDDAGPSSVVLKVAARDETSRRTGLALGLYEREVRFYAEVAPAIGGPLSPCYHASFDPEGGTFCLLLGDAGPARQGDEIRGCGYEEALTAVRALAQLHVPALDHAGMAGAEWLNRETPVTQALVESLLPGFLERYADRIAPEHREVCERLVASFDAYMEQEQDAPKGLVHGDYRLDNLLFGEHEAPRPLTVVDWQTVSWGPALTDLAYFLGCALTVADRRAFGEQLVREYHAGLGGKLTYEQCLDGVRRQSFFGVMMAIISPMLVERTERGDDMFMTVLERHAQQVLDLDALEILPAPTAPPPRRPVPEDEHPHAPGREPLWNESWYLDFIDAEQGVGGYVRLGCLPNQGRSWYTAVVCGPDRPTVAVLDYAAPLPDAELEVCTEDLHATQRCVAPLERYRVTLRALGEAHEDPAAFLRGDRGQAVEVELELEWRTTGEPYRYRLADRYEIACGVTGTLRIGEERFTIDAVPGQRDHSWGVRDWWSMDWVWAAGQLDDGTRLHAVDLRVPGAPRIGVGYVQAPGAALVEAKEVIADEVLGPDGLPRRTRLRLEPGDLDLEVEPLGHGPLRLESEDGRVAMFPRAWCRLSAADGRTGVAWLEWNCNLDE